MKKNIFSRIISAAAAASMLVFAGGCGNSSSGSAGTQAETEAQTEAPVASENDNSLQAILDKGELVLGSDASFPPLGFPDENGNIVGFDVEVAQEVCARLNVKLTVKTIEWENKDAELNSGAIDCLWDGMSITPERAESMCLSEPYLKNAVIFVVPQDSQIFSMDDLGGKKIGVQKATTSEDILNASDLDITVFPEETIDIVLDKLEAGETDAVLMDSVVANYLVSTGERKLMFLPDEYEEEEYAIGFRKDDVKLRNEVQNILHDMKEDGTLAQISVKWFGSDVTLVK